MVGGPVCMGLGGGLERFPFGVARIFLEQGCLAVIPAKNQLGKLIGDGSDKERERKKVRTRRDDGRTPNTGGPTKAAGGSGTCRTRKGRNGFSVVPPASSSDFERAGRNDWDDQIPETGPQNKTNIAKAPVWTL